MNPQPDHARARSYLVEAREAIDRAIGILDRAQSFSPFPRYQGRPLWLVNSEEALYRAKDALSYIGQSARTGSNP